MASTSANTTDVLSSTYAQALFELALSSNQLDEVADEVQQLAELIERESDLRALLANPAIDLNARKGILERLFAGKVSDLTLRFLYTVNRKNRSGHLGSIFQAFLQQVDAHRGIVPASAIVANELPQDRLEAVAGELARSLGVQQVRLSQVVNDQLIGGLQLRVGDQLLDASVATQLKGLQKQLETQGRERARVAAQAEE